MAPSLPRLQLLQYPQPLREPVSQTARPRSAEGRGLRADGRMFTRSAEEEVPTANHTGGRRTARRRPPQLRPRPTPTLARGPLIALGAVSTFAAGNENKSGEGKKKKKRKRKKPPLNQSQNQSWWSLTHLTQEKQLPTFHRKSHTLMRQLLMFVSSTSTLNLS